MSGSDVQRLVLVRHARPAGDSPLRFLGRADPGLAEVGREQSRKLARAAPEMLGLPVWSSPLRRARETAELAFPGVKIQIELLAAELSFGVVDGLLPEEAARLYPEALQHLRRCPLDAAPLGGESWSDLMARARELAAILEREPGLVLVSHRYLLTALVQHLIGTEAVSPSGLDYGGRWWLERTIPGGPWRVSPRS